MELDPRLKALCLILLDAKNVPILSEQVRQATVQLLQAQARLIQDLEIPTLTDGIEEEK